jgi:PAS domain S-box-containing protein
MSIPPPVELIPPDQHGALLDTVEEVVGLGTYIWEIGRRVLWSRGFFRLLGLAPGEMMPSTVFFERVHPEDRARVVMAWQIAAQQGRVESFAYRLVRPDGQVRRVIGRGVFTDRGSKLVGTIVDVTEIEQARERLAEALAVLADTQRAAGVGTYVYDLTRKRIEWSEELHRLIGVPVGAAVEPETWLTHIHEDDRERQRDYFWRVVAGEQPPPIRVRVRRSDGSEIHLESIARRLERPNGPCVVGVTMDVTARVELEDRLRQAATMDAIGTLAAGVAHDFNNYLTVLSVQIDAIRAGRRTANERDLASMADAVDRASGLVRQLLAFARRHPFQPCRLDLVAQVEAVIGLFRRVSGPELEIVFRADGPLPVHADAAQLDGAVMNLLVNARDAMPHGGTLTVELDAEAGNARLRVIDTGCGIAPELLPRIFEPYFTTKTEGGGVGLGLAAVYGVVRQHGGHIDVSSSVGRGTTFEVCLPLSPGGEHAAPPPATEPSVQGLRILLVEDVDAVRDALAMLLVDEGHQVEAAADGQAALERVRGGGGFDVVLSDVVMPRLDGHGLVRRLAEEQPELPVILMSGYADRRIDETRVVAWLDKPFSRQQLLSVLARIGQRES